MSVDNSGALRVVPQGWLIDAFGRMAVSEPTTLFDSKQIHDDSPLFWDEVTNGAAQSYFLSGHSAVNMVVSNAGEYAIRQTKMRMNYQPGKSHQILMTANLNTGSAGVVKRVGYFNSATNAPYTNNRDGFWLEQSGADFYLVTSKSGVENRVIRSNWNNPLDGIRSAQSFDLTKTFIIQWRMEWLGVGSLIAYLIIDGVPVEIHRFNHAGKSTDVYIQSPNHSLRYEIYSTGGTNSLKHICSSVSSEGGSDLLGTIRYASTSGSQVVAGVENVAYGIVGIRLKTNYIDTTIRLLDVALQIQSATKKIEWFLVLNPVITNVPVWADLDNSAMQFTMLTNEHRITGGIQIGGGFMESGGVSAGSAGSTAKTIENALRLGAKINGDRDFIFLCARPVGGTSAVDIEAAIYWREQL
jgi:hypothetical protein